MKDAIIEVKNLTKKFGDLLRPSALTERCDQDKKKAYGKDIEYYSKIRKKIRSLLDEGGHNAGDEEPACVLVAVELAITGVELACPGNAHPVFAASWSSGVVPLKRVPSGNTHVG